MKFFPCLVVWCPAICLLAQTPPPPKPAQATPAGDVKLSVENAPPKVFPQVPPDRVVITVGDIKITAAQFDQIVDSVPEQYRAQAHGAGRKRFADNITRVFVIAQEGQRRKVNETPSFRTLSKFSEANVLAGLTLEQIGKENKLDDAAVRKYYDEHKAEFEQVRARHILIRMQGSPVPVRPGQKDLSDADALAKVQDLRKKLQGGANFAALATQESDDTGSGANGGDLGFFGHGRMVPSFDEAAFKLKPGEISEPVKTQFGYHLIKVEATKSFDDVRADVETKLKPQQSQKVIDELEKKTPVVLDPEFFGLEKKLEKK